MPAPNKKPKKRIPQLNYLAASHKHVEFHNTRDKPVRILCGGVGASKSFPACYEILANLILNPLYNGKRFGKASKAMVVGLTDKHNREQLLPHFLAILTQFNKRGQNIGFIEKLDYWYTVSPLKITIANGAEIMFHSVEGGATLPGFNVAIVMVDEIDKGPQSVWNDAFDRMGRQIGNPNGFLIGTCNPGSRSHWLAKQYFARYEDTAVYDVQGNVAKHGVMPDGVGLWQFTIYDNPHMAHKWKQWENQYGYSELERRKKLLGRFVNMEGLVFSSWDRDKHTYPALPANQIHSDDRVKIEWPRWRGVDFGGVDATACVWVAKNPDDDTFFIYREYLKSLVAPADNAKAILGMTGRNERIGKTYSDHYVETRMTYKQAGLDLTPATKGPGSIEAGVNLIRQLLDSGRLKIRADLHSLIEEIETYQYDDKNGKIKSNQQDHLLDSTRYVLWAVAGDVRDYAVASSAPKPLSAREEVDPNRTLFAFEPDGTPIYCS